MMKKISIFLMLILSVIFNASAYAKYEVICETITGNDKLPLVYIDGEPPVLTEINGQQYFWNSLRYGNHIIKYNEETKDAYDFLKEQTDCIWTGKYYMTRNSSYDKQGLKYKSFIKNPIKFYDKDFNLVHEQVFGSSAFYNYPESIDYRDGIYYCEIDVSDKAGTIIMSSEDMVNWVEDNDYKSISSIGNAVYTRNSSYQALVSVHGSEFYLLKDENKKTYTSIKLGEYICRVDKSGLYFTKDRIYWLHADLPEEIDNISYSEYSGYAYEYGDDIVVQTSNYLFRVPKEYIYIGLDELDKAPYIVLNSTLLRFEQPPIIEDDRTLIPIRFLFEQMGATVDWNGDTQTATISQDNTAVSFSIDDTEADVNGQTVSMDVPAQLINGKTMVPVRFLSEELGYDVDWDGENRIITIE